MRASYWLIGLCCFCLGCAVWMVSSYAHSESLFLVATQFVIF